MTQQNTGVWNELCKCENGPGTTELKRAVQWLIDCGDPRIDQKRRNIPILWFGTTKKNYRSFPVRLSGIVLNNGKFDLGGYFHYPKRQKGGRAFHGKKIRIIGYDPHKRTADKVESFEVK